MDAQVTFNHECHRHLAKLFFIYSRVLQSTGQQMLVQAQDRLFLLWLKLHQNHLCSQLHKCAKPHYQISLKCWKSFIWQP